MSIPFFKVEAANIAAAPLIKDLSFGPVGNRLLQAMADLLPLSPRKSLAAIEQMAEGGEQLSVEGGREWTDAITPTNSAHGLPLSQRLIDAMREHNLQGFKTTPITVVKAHRKLPCPWPPYHLFSARGSLRFEYHYYERVAGTYEFRFMTLDPKNDERCGRFFRADGFIPHVRLVPRMEHWDGSDFFATGGSSNSFYGSRRFVELARQLACSNLCCVPIDVISHRLVDLRDRSGPPETWYPAGHPPSAFGGTT